MLFKISINLDLGRSKSRMPRKRQGGSSIGRLTPSQNYHRNRHRSRSRSRSSSSENDKSDSESENTRSRSRSTRVSNSTTRTESRSRSAFQSVQHKANKQRDARLQKMMQIRPLFTSTLINSEMKPQSET